MILKRKDNNNKLYHPNNMDDHSEWLMCNALIGAQPYDALGQPMSIGDVQPEWYGRLSDSDQAKLEYVWAKQEQYLSDLLHWITSKGIKRCFFDGAYDNNESWFREKYHVSEDGFIAWLQELEEDLSKVNVHNVFLEAEDGTGLIAYETWDTVFVKDSSNNFPSKLKNPSVGLENLPN